MIRLLIFLDPAGERWLRLDADAVTARGTGLAALPQPVEETIAIVPGDAVVVHWVELPPLAPAQTAAAARLLAADVSAAPLDSTHVAIGHSTVNANPDGIRPLALVDNQAMANWLARLAAAGVDPDRILPAPLLLPVPLDDGVTILEHDGQWLAHGARLAFAAEPMLARMMIGTRHLTPLAHADFESGLAFAIATAPLDLRQGRFARTRKWVLDRRRIRRLALLAACLLGAMLATQVAALLRHSFAADRAELQLADAARAVLPRGTIVTDPQPQVAARLASLGGDGAAFTALAAPLLGALRDRPAMSLHSLEFSPQTGLVAVLAAPATDRDALVATLATDGLDATLGAPRDQAGEQVTDLTVRRR